MQDETSDALPENVVVEFEAHVLGLSKSFRNRCYPIVIPPRWGSQDMTPFDQVCQILPERATMVE